MEDSSDIRPWPQNFKPIVIRGIKYFKIDQSLLLALGVKIHVKNKGFKELDNLLETHGLSVSDEYLFKNTKIRTHITCKAAILVLFTWSSSRKGEDVTVARELRCHLIDIIVDIAATCNLLETANQEATDAINGSDPGLAASAPVLEPATPLPESPVPVLEPATPSPASTRPLVESATPSPTTSAPLPASVTCTPLMEPSQSKSISTESLLNRQRTIRSQQLEKGRKYKSRTVVRRLKLQKQNLAQLAKSVHYGSKQDFLLSLGQSVCHTKPSAVTQDADDWDGSLSPQDILTLAKDAHDPVKRMSVYDTILTESAPQHYHLSAFEVLNIQDTTSATEIIRTLRRKLPGFLDSERKVNSIKAKYVREFEIVWKPKRTHSGWQIDPQRLHETLLYLYWWLPKSEWWKIYGDGRNFGGKDSVAITLNILNNEAMFNGLSYHSPDDYWPVSVFYGKDTRLNLELNLGDPEKHGSLNKWVQAMLDSGHIVYLSADSKFYDNLLGGGLDPTSEDAFNMYNYETKQTRSEVGCHSGLRSELSRKIEREHPESLLPSLPTTHYIPDGNHCFCRLTEHMVFDRCMSCLNLESQPSMGPAAKDQTLGHFLSNINARGVRNGAFELQFDGKKLDQVTLNVNHSETISAPTSYFVDNQFSEILDNVASKDILFELPEKLQEHLKWPTPKISEYDLEMKIWRIHWELHELERLDEDPKKYPDRLKPGSIQGSSNPKDYRFGLNEEQIQRYVELADLYHALTLLRYGSSKLYPYLMKRVDVFPQMLRDLPFHSLFRGGTEGGERTHYLHQCLYFGHSARGGGWKCPDPVITLFRWYYRFLRRRLANCPAAVQEAYDQYVQEKFAEDGLDYNAEMRAAESPASTDHKAVPQESSHVSEQTDCDHQAVPEESSHVSEQTVCTSTQCLSSQSPPVQTENLSGPVLQDSTVGPSPSSTFKRGDTVFVEKDGKTTKAMVCEITPQKKRLKVAVAAKERPVLVEIANLQEPTPQVLRGLTFVISGRLNDKDKTGINNAEQLTPVILRNGGKVYNKDISKVLDANFVMVTSQKELDKDIKKINKPIIHAYRYKWPIVSKLFVLQADKEKNIPEIYQYKLNLAKLNNAPQSSLLQAKPVMQSELLGQRKRSAHRDLKKVLRQKRKLAQEEEPDSENVPKREPKRAANGYIVFLKQEYGKLAQENPEKSLKEINAMLSEKWKSTSEEEKVSYKERGKTEFQQKTEQWSKTQEKARALEHPHPQTFAFMRMN